jgi:hypothetical protein
MTLVTGFLWVRKSNNTSIEYEINGKERKAVCGKVIILD